MRTASLVALVCLATACSGGGSATDAGVDAGFDGGTTTEARPERVVKSSDSRAFLWIPDGGAPASAPIVVEPIDGGWRLSPAGMTFERPALLFFEMQTFVPDAGAGFLGAQLRSEDGGVEKVGSYAAAAVGHEGAQLGIGIVRVPHFSDVELTGGDGTRAPEGLDVELELEPGIQTFTRYNLEQWVGSITLDRGATSPGGSNFAGFFRLEASGALSIPPQSPDVTAPVAVDLINFPRHFSNFNLRCKQLGIGELTLYVWNAELTRLLVRTHSGTCRIKDAVEAVDPTRATPQPNEASAETALTAAVGTALQLAEPQLSAGETSSAAAVAKEPVSARATQVVLGTWQLDCADCTVGQEYLGRFTLTNLTSVASTVTGGSIVARASGFLLTPIVGNGSLVGPNHILLNKPVLAAGQATTYAINYMCLGDFEGRLTTTVGVESASFGHKVASFVSPTIKCGKGGDALMLSENRRVTKNGAGWTVAAPGATANVIHATDAVRAKFHPINGTSQIYAGVTSFASNAGLTPLVLKSSLQTATASFAANRYGVTGLMGAAVYAPTDALTIEHVPAAGPTVSLVVPAPPPTADVATLFGPRAGLSTEIRIPDGTFDVFFVSISAGPPGAPAGQNGVLRSVSAASMQLMGGNRVAPLIDAETIQVLDELGWTVQTIYLAYYRESSTPLFFPGLRPLPAQAGRMFQVTPADLAP